MPTGTPAHLPQRRGFLHEWSRALAEWLGFEPAPGTPEHREALLRAIKAENDEEAKPPGQRDELRLLELRKRSTRLTIEAAQVTRSMEAAAAAAAAQLDAPAALSTHPRRCYCDLQAKQQLLRRNADVLQRLDLGCCPDCPRVHQREVASLRAAALWHEQWERVYRLQLEALEQGHPDPPLILPYLDVRPFLPEGMPEDLPPSIDRCADCQRRLEEVRRRGLSGCRRGAGAAGSRSTAVAAA